MEKVTGIGGLFIKAKDIKSLSAWYQKYLGIEFGNNSYIDFKWVNKNNPAVPGHTVFHFLKTIPLILIRLKRAKKRRNTGTRKC